MSLSIKTSYVLYPSATPYAVLTLRCIVTVIILVPIILYKQYKQRDKHNLILSWMQHSYLMWFCAIGHILVVSVLVQISLSKFPIAVVSIFLNTGPILTVLLGGLLVRSEQVTLGTVLKAIAAESFESYR